MTQSSDATAALFALMRTQHGVASRRQARNVGVSRAVERRLVNDGSVRPLLPGVIAAGGMPMSRLTMLHAATLGRGVIAISHGAAGRVHGFSAFRGYEPIDIIGGRSARLSLTTPLLTHYSRGPLDGHVVLVEGVPVISPALTLVQVAPMLGRRAIAIAVGEVISGGVSATSIRRVADSWRATGRAGPSIVLAALDVSPRAAPSGSPAGRAATVLRRDVAGAT